MKNKQIIYCDRCRQIISEAWQEREAKIAKAENCCERKCQPAYRQWMRARNKAEKEYNSVTRPFKMIMAKEIAQAEKDYFKIIKGK